MKKAKFIVLVLGVILAFAMFAVACDDKPLPDDSTPPETETYTVTFVNGETTVKEAEVQKGNALTAENMPGNPTTDADEEFDGWFSGETEIKVGYIPTADVTASAVFTQLKKVEFKVGEEVVKTVYVRPGAALSAEQLPEEPDMSGYSFSGWYNEGVLFDTDENTVSADMTLVANFVKTSYIIKFEADGEVIDTKYIAIGPDAKFEVTDIPSAPASEEGEVFLGWYNGGVKAVSGGAVTADGTYVATFVSEASYTGVWYNDSEKIMVYFENGKINIMDLYEKTYTYDSAAGSISFEEGILLNKKSFTLLATGDVMQLTYGHYNEYDEPVTDEYVLYKAAPVDYAGVYNKDKDKILTVADGGIVTYFNGSNYYARMYADGDAYKIEFKSDSNHDMKTVNAVVDDLGNIVVTGDGSVDNGYKGVFVKGMKSVSYYYNDDSNYLYVYTLQDDSVLYVFTEDFTAFDYAVIEGTVATDNIITITAFDKEYIAKIVSSYMEFASEERGEYTLSGGSDKITLDGFGSATVGGETKAYYMLGTTAVFDNGEGGAAVLDLTGKTYTNAVRDGKQGTFTYFDGWSDKIVILDGFGGLVKEGSDSTDYGTYVFAGNKVTFVGVEDGVYTVTADGNVFVDDKDEFHAFVKKDYVVDSQIDSFVGDNAGWWVNDADPADYLFVDTVAEKVTYKGKSYSYEATWDGSKLLVSSWFDEFVFSINAGKVNVTYEDDNGSPVTDVYTSAPEPVIEQDEYVGVWKAGGKSFWFDGYGTVVVNEDAVKYIRQPDNSVKFEANGMTYTALLSGGTMSISWDDGEGSGTYNDTAPAVLDAFAGVWNAPAEDDYQYVLTFSGAGVVHVYCEGEYSVTDKYVSYSVAKNVATFSVYSENWTCTVDGDSMTVLAVNTDGYSSVNSTYTKQVEAAADAFAGTYSNGTNTLVFNGDGTGKFNDDAFTYTVSGDVANINPFGVFDGDSNTATLGEDGSIQLNLNASNMENAHSGNYVKQTEAQPDAFAGTWTGKVGPNTYTVVCDGLGNITINGNDYTYTPGTDTIVAGYFTVTMKDADTMHVVYANDDEYIEFEGDLTKSA